MKVKTIGIDLAKDVSCSEELRFLLQPGPDASLIAQECTSFSPPPAEACSHCINTNPRRTPSSIRPGLGFD